MASFGVRLPVSRNDVHGYTMIEDFRTLIRQNLKMLILTAPGERVMVPNFGVGVRNYLFENFGSTAYIDIESKIREQVSIYMTAVAIIDIQFNTEAIDRNTLGLVISYAVPDIGITDLLKFTI